MQQEENKRSKEEIYIFRLQLLLSHLRTTLSLLRTGIAIFTLPLAVFTFLIATSKNYDVMSVLHFLIPLGIILLALVGLAVWLIVVSLIRWRRTSRLIDAIKKRDEHLREFLE